MRVATEGDFWLSPTVEEMAQTRSFAALRMTNYKGWTEMDGCEVKRSLSPKTLGTLIASPVSLPVAVG